MKKLLLILLLLIVQSIQAETVTVTALGGKFNVVILSIETLDNTYFEVSPGEVSAIGVKYKLPRFNNYTLYLGANHSSFHTSIPNDNPVWAIPNINIQYSVVMPFIEIEHSNGLILKASYYNEPIYRKYIAYDKEGNITDEKIVTKKVIDTLIWLGYRWRF